METVARDVLLPQTMKGPEARPQAGALSRRPQGAVQGVFWRVLLWWPMLPVLAECCSDTANPRHSGAMGPTLEMRAAVKVAFSDDLSRVKGAVGLPDSREKPTAVHGQLGTCRFPASHWPCLSVCKESPEAWGTGEHVTAGPLL